MHRTRTTLLLAAFAALVLCAPASANYRVGLSEQNAAVFDQPAWQDLKLKRIRYVIPWDYYKVDFAKSEADQFLNLAHQHKQDVLLMFTAHRGCWNGKRYSKRKACRLPSRKRYKRAFKHVRKDYPWVKTFAPWNEANHKSQPTSRNPKRAAQYFRIMDRGCRKCRVLAADVLDQSNVRSWLRRFQRHSHNRGRIWGLHNYKDVNRRQSKGIRNVLRTVRGQVWLTETGGIVKFKSSGFKRSERRAANRTKYMFKLVDRWDKRRRGYKSKITRIYVYRWFGEPRGRFDAGLMDADGSPRRAFKQFKKYVRHHKK
jgi:hypothetical protein